MPAPYLHRDPGQVGHYAGPGRALRVLARHGTMRLKDLSGHLNISPRSGTEVVDELARRDLVRRTPDPADRRAVLVELTAEGERVSVAMRSARATDAERTFERAHRPGPRRSAADPEQAPRLTGPPPG